jgi:hypothetical protein
MRKRKAIEYRAIAQEIARDNIVTHALSRLIEQIVAEVHAVKQKEVDALRDILKQARPYVGLQETSKYEAAARDAFALGNAIDAALRETGDGDESGFL